MQKIIVRLTTLAVTESFIRGYSDVTNQLEVLKGKEKITADFLKLNKGQRKLVQKYYKLFQEHC